MIQPRNRSLTTDLQPDEPVLLVYGQDASACRIAEQLASRLSRLDIKSRLLGDVDFEDWRCRRGVTFLLGNLADCAVARELYYRFLLVTDKTYPGVGGYEIRTLCDPLGSGSNILFLGYSDEAGLEAGWKELETKIELSIPFLNQVKAVGFPLPDHEMVSIREAEIPDPAWRASSDVPCVNKGYLGYLSGEQDLLDAYFEIWQSILDYGLPRGDHNIKDRHLWLAHLISSFRLLEAAGLVPNPMRGAIFAHLLEWVDSEHGLEHIQKPEFTKPGMMRQNHGTLPALGLAYLADFVDTHHPDEVDTGPWWELIWDVFHPYKNGSWKPACDGLCHGWYLSQPALLDFGLLEPNRHYFENGGARSAAECAMAVVNPLGWMPSAGDSHLLRSFPGKNLRMAAAYYQDGRYAFVHDTASRYRRLKSHILPVRAFDRGLDPVIPEDQVGVTVVPMDPVVYATGEAAGQSKTPYFQTPPSISLERCFDKLAFRSGWEQTDAYLLLDGLGGGSHAYWDALEVTDYTTQGFSFIVSETGGKFPETESHGVLTLYREGRASRVPEFAELLDAETSSADSGYARAALRDYQGADWIREVYFFGNSGFVVLDTVRAKEAGLYTVESHFRIPGPVDEDANQVFALRESAKGSVLIFGLIGTCSHEAQVFVRTEDKSGTICDRESEKGLPPEGSRETAWYRRYGIESKLISTYTQRASVQLESGETLSFIHAGAARGQSRPNLQVTPGDGGAVSVHLDQFQTELKSRESARPASPEADLSRKEYRGAALNLQVSEPFPEPVRDLQGIPGGEFLAQAGDQTLVRLDAAGDCRERFSTPGPVHAYRAFGTRNFAGIFVSHGKNCISRMDTNGKVLWTSTIEAIPSSSPWWELENPRAVSLEVLESREGDFLCVAGCGDMHVRGFGADGALQWTFRYQNGVPGQLLKIRHPGLPEALVVAAGEIISNQSTLRLLNAQGELKLEIPIEGWTSKLPGIDCFSRKEECLVAAGATRGVNFQVHRLKIHNGQLESDPLIRDYVGGAAAVVKYCPELDQILVGTRQGMLLAYGFDGILKWSQVFPGAVLGIHPWRDQVLVGSQDGQGVLFNARGEVSGTISTPASWNLLQPAGEHFLLPHQKQLIVLKMPT